ncbi:hypothetical protein EOI86_02100 [Hwanghaeella grinnelliae]|uniref:Uncharacterized protein n=1 Tax=Hwanghaeella grinnelliae TaxID=2500179 RepID=A0A437QUF3_9PROT|nr:hypothetical protein [Hwanghaeella grinnelliae]RVU38119.1 hypothetical protein EOI86_02100 [Hwanghaeella grinnelliae]
MAFQSLKPGKSVRIDGNLPSIDSHFLDHVLPIFTHLISTGHCSEKEVAARYFHQTMGSPAKDRTVTGAEKAARHQKPAAVQPAPRGGN